MNVSHTAMLVPLEMRAYDADQAAALMIQTFTVV